MIEKKPRPERFGWKRGDVKIVKPRPLKQQSGEEVAGDRETMQKDSRPAVEYER